MVAEIIKADQKIKVEGKDSLGTWEFLAEVLADKSLGSRILRLF